MPPRTVQAVLVPLALTLPVLLLVRLMAAAVSAEDGGGVDPEVTVCRQQCARQRQFSAVERRYCLRQCDEYGRAKRREEKEREEDTEGERDRCLHECRAGPPKPGCERRCREAYDRATRGRGDNAGSRDLASVPPARRVGGGLVAS